MFYFIQNFILHYYRYRHLWGLTTVDGSVEEHIEDILQWEQGISVNISLELAWSFFEWAVNPPGKL